MANADRPALPSFRTTEMPTTKVHDNNKALTVQAGKQYTDNDHESSCSSSPQCAHRAVAPAPLAHNCVRVYQSPKSVKIRDDTPSPSSRLRQRAATTVIIPAASQKCPTGKPTTTTGTYSNPSNNIRQQIQRNARQCQAQLGQLPSTAR